MQGMLGSIMLFGGNYAPRDWMFCSGQMLSVQQYTALYSILGTIYGGNGQTTFQLPNLNGRVVIGAGTQPPPGVSQYVPGQFGGAESTILTIGQLPQHLHANTLNAQPTAISVNVQIPSVSNTDANLAKPNNTAVPGKMSSTTMYSNATPDGNMKPFNATGSVTPNVTINNAITGANQPIDNRQPFLAMNYIICVNGLYPARN